MHEQIKCGQRGISRIRPLTVLAFFSILLLWPPRAPGQALFAKHPDAYFAGLAEKARRGLYPRGFSGEQVYWTIVGVDGSGFRSALFSEDGSVEPRKGGFSVEPFLAAGGRLLTWADSVSSQGLAEGYLPMPEVTRQASSWNLRIRAFASGPRSDSFLHVDYRVQNSGNRDASTTLVLAVRPFQVDPPTQFLNTKGGFSPIDKIGWSGGAVRVNGRVGLFSLDKPDKFIASGFASGDIISAPGSNFRPRAGARGDREASEPSGRASGAMLFGLRLKPGQSRTIHLLAPLSGQAKPPRCANLDPRGWTARERRAVAAVWRAKLNDVTIHAPRSARSIIDTLRTSLAYILISRNGAALRPGTRSYARSWIRDGAMMSRALLRMGDSKAVRDFIDWYAPFQFKSGKAPCCVDWRGADTTPENDSQGEFISTIAQFHSYTHDRAELEELWPRIERAVHYMDLLRAQESTPANLTHENRPDYGLMPASISHEGYCKKPMHSYWDDFWSLRGYDDALHLARALGKFDRVGIIAASRDRFRKDLTASIKRAVKRHKIDYLPGCAELGDLDPTSEAIEVSFADESAFLPKGLLENTFRLYWHDFLARRDGKRSWNDYTPYELRMVGAFVRLGRRRRAKSLLDFFMKDRRPPAWNGWAEVVRRDRRKPGFIGDMPHAWIASEFIRSVLDMFAYRGARSSLVIGAGIPTAWFQGRGAGVERLRTPWGRLGYSLRRRDNLLRLRLDCASTPPGGFIFPWPYAGAPGPMVSGAGQAHWRGNRLHIDSAHALVTFEIPPGERQTN